MLMPGRNGVTDVSNAYRYGFQGQERDDEVKGLANHMSFKNYGYDPRIGRRWQVDPEIKRGPQFSPFIFTFDNPTNFVDENGKWAYWSHYKMTKKALIKAGFSKATAKEIAYYASTYADDPKLVPQILGVVVGLFNFIAPSQFVKNEKKYQNSEMSYSQKDYTKGVAIHAMRGWDEDITEEEAVHRALYGGVFTDEKGKKHKIEGAYNVLKRLAGIDEKDLTQDQKKEIGKAIHTIQDAEAHKGGRWVDEHKKQAKAKGRKKRHSTWRDLFGNKSKAKAATKKAVDILKGN